MGKRLNYSATFKFNVVREHLTCDRTDAEIAREHGIHPVTLSKWKKTFPDEGAKVFGGDDTLREKEKEIARLERMLGKKEVELALAKNFFRNDERQRKSPSGREAPERTWSRSYSGRGGPATEYLVSTADKSGSC